MEGSRQARARALHTLLQAATGRKRAREPWIFRRVGPTGAARSTRRRPPPRGPSLAAAKLTFQHRSLSLSSSWLGSVVEFGPQAAYSPKSAS